MNINIDTKDLSILSILQTRGRIAISELAAKLNMSDTPCLRRVKKLEEAGVISGYSANIKPESMGFNAMVYVFIRLTENSNISADLFENAMKKLPEVLELGLWMDPKSRFQESSQEIVGITPIYKVLKEEGPDHAKEFVVGVYLDKEKIAEGKI